MKTIILKPNSKALQKAALLLKKGDVVAFPTETVYGLGADAFNPAAVRKIFVAKERPADDPLIVHAARVSDVARVAAHVPPAAQKLMKAFWPGPLTLVMPKAKAVPGIVTAGLPTVAVRMPGHPVALKLCSIVGPIAAPSANSFGRPSPTRAKHVYDDLKSRIPLIIDGGSTDIGIESTIVSLAGKPRLLRPGRITIEQLKRFLPDIEIATQVKKDEKPIAPGMKYQHYSPDTQLVLVARPTAEKVQKLVECEQAKGKRVGLLCSGRYHVTADKVVMIGKTPETAGKVLFEALRWLDTQRLDVIVAEGWPESGFGMAVMNRLRRAAKKIV
jgi:L-threonylcarbamoyladenylate synthase